MKVGSNRISQGDGLCEEICPDVLTLLDEGFATQGRFDGVRNRWGHPQGAEGMANFADNLTDAVIEAAEECPGECIFIEP